MKKVKIFLMLAVLCLSAGQVFAAGLKAKAVFKFADPKKEEVREIELTEKAGIQFLTIKADSVPEEATRLNIYHPWAQAQAGEDGFYVLCNGMYGTFRKQKKDAEYRCTHHVMSMYGVRSPRGAFTAILKGFRYEATYTVSYKKGVYQISPEYKLDGSRPYSDITIEFHPLKKDASYADVAKVYRQYQLNNGTVVSLKERIKNRPELEYAAKSMEIRVRMAWKPVPSPVKYQTADTEPKVKPVITFERFKKIVDEFKKLGIDKAEFCLVGWNIGGHDGRYPQILPPEPTLGSYDQLKEAIAHAKKNGFQTVCHTNYSDSYTVSHLGGCWDENFLLVRKDGMFNTYTTWGGGAMYETCPKCMFERFPDKDFPRLKDLGFRGLHYIDVYSTVNPRTCYSKDHPLTKEGFAVWTKKIMAKAQKDFGGFASEGGFDYCISNLDFALYISFNKPGAKLPALVDRHVPIWQLVYNGIVLNNPYTHTTNYTIKDSIARLKLIEFGGRPHFYFYSKFLTTGNNWMGDADITCDTDDDLVKNVQKIKEGYDEFEKLRWLQFEFMDDHQQIAENVFKTVFSDGTMIITNYNEKPFMFKGQKVNPMNYIVIK